MNDLATKRPGTCSKFHRTGDDGVICLETLQAVSEGPYYSAGLSELQSVLITVRASRL